MNEKVNSVTEAFRKARNQQVENLKKSFKPTPKEDDEELEVSEKKEEKTPVGDEKKSEVVIKANMSDSEFLDYAMNNGILEMDKSIMKAVYCDNELNRTLGIVGDEFDVEKSDIMDAINNFNNNIKISKTGKQIKEQAKNVVIPDKKNCMKQCEDDANKLLEECGEAPTHPIYKWWVDDLDIEVPFKIYNYEETYIPERGVGIAETLSPNDALLNRPSSQKEAQARRDYNDKVHCICDLAVDIKVLEILLNNLDDKAKFELTPRQIIALKF